MRDKPCRQFSRGAVIKITPATDTRGACHVLALLHCLRPSSGGASPPRCAWCFTLRAININLRGGVSLPFFRRRVKRVKRVKFAKVQPLFSHTVESSCVLNTRHARGVLSLRPAGAGHTIQHYPLALPCLPCLPCLLIYLTRPAC